MRVSGIQLGFPRLAASAFTHLSHLVRLSQTIFVLTVPLPLLVFLRNALQLSLDERASGKLGWFVVTECKYLHIYPENLSVRVCRTASSSCLLVLHAAKHEAINSGLPVICEWRATHLGGRRLPDLSMALVLRH